MYAQLSDEIRPFTQKDNDKTDARFPNWHQEPGLVPKDAQIITDEGVKMSHATDDASIKEKFTEYEAAGKFAYLSASTIGSMGVSKGLSNFFSIAEIHHVKDLIRFSVSDVAFFHNFGAVKCLELLSLLEKTNGFLYENTGWYSSFKPGMKDSLDDMPTFKDLYISGELDAYLAEGEELADKRNPKWRAELGLPPKKAKFSAGEQNAKEKFIIEHIAKSVNRIGRSFETPLDRVHPLFGGETIKELNGKTNAEGETLDFLGDLVLVGRQKLVENFGVNEEQIAVLDKTLPMYRLNLDMRTEAEAVYAQQTANANQPPASDDAQRQDKKKAYFKTYFTAP